MALKRGVTPPLPADDYPNRRLGPAQIYLDDLDLLIEALEGHPWHATVTKQAGPSSTWDTAEDLRKANPSEIRNLRLEVLYRPHDEQASVQIVLMPERAYVRSRHESGRDLVNAVAAHCQGQWPLPHWWQIGSFRKVAPFSLASTTAGLIGLLSFGLIVGWDELQNSTTTGLALAMYFSVVLIWGLTLLPRWMQDSRSGVRVVKRTREEAEKEQARSRGNWTVATVTALLGAIIGATATFFFR